MRLGLVLSNTGRHCWVQEDAQPQGQRLLCHVRSKKNEAVVGDLVHWVPSGDEGLIEAILPRRSLFHRQDAWRTKRFAANVDLLLFCVASEPAFSERQLARALIAAEAAHIDSLIVLNKADLALPHARALARLQPYQAMGYPLRSISVRAGDLADLAPLLQQKTILILGPSGVGKSSLVNLFAPQAEAKTQEISYALGSGKHTTSVATWHWAEALGASTALIDSPGFQEFGLHHIQAADLPSLMPDIAAHTGACRFYNCTHVHEPGCGVLAQLGQSISATRHALYVDIRAELGKGKA